MSRYIDADKLVERLKFKRNTDNIDRKKYAGLECAISQVKKQPTADVVEVIRCKDCKYLKYGYQCYRPLGINLSNAGDAYVLVNPEDDFCSGAKRREDTK